ncbi:MAG: bacillithiol biosynthesis cysteine-adding enzyme BshC [Bacteroidetes bacterium B1(2017)]|nr:MAG: bacillithiol biosynthesis cysteine-adding enzyme BshC [Bacteroidetes bacterium B1(2017)]
MFTRIADVPLQETNLGSDLLKDYLSQKQELTPLVNVWQDLNSFDKLIATRNFDPAKRPVLVQHLKTQYLGAGIELSENRFVETNIESLLEPTTFTITTGHQLSLFGGTLFMAYKILTAIKTAAELKERFPQHAFVPVLWLASEDHDFEEIKSTYLFGKKITWELESKEQATGKLPLSSMASVITGLKELLGDKSQAINWIQKIENAYQEPYTLGEASIRFYNSLFEKFGLVILDADDAKLKKFFVPIMEQDILGQTTFAVQSVSDKALAQNYKLQINARPINFFYLDEALGRKMIKKDENSFSYAEGGKQFTSDELKKELTENPQNFSPNVNLRPVYQETILPNLAYIGGPGEISYWLQLKPVFDFYKVPYPMVLLRYMNVILGKGLLAKFEKLGVSSKEVLLDEKSLVQFYISSTQPTNFPAKFEEIVAEFQYLVDHTKNLDVQLGKDFLEQKLVLKEFFKSKLPLVKKALEQNEGVQLEKLLKLRSRIFPEGVLQERIETLLQQEIMHDTHLLTSLLETIEPANGKISILEAY